MPTPTRVSFPLTNFQFPDGNPVANGSVYIRLSQDAAVNTLGDHIQRNFSTVQLDSSGNMIGSPTFWKNSDLLPSGSYYIYNVYSDKGLLVAGPNNITI